MNDALLCHKTEQNEYFGIWSGWFLLESYGMINLYGIVNSSNWMQTSLWTESSTSIHNFCICLRFHYAIMIIDSYVLVSRQLVYWHIKSNSFHRLNIIINNLKNQTKSIHECVIPQCMHWHYYLSVLSKSFWYVGRKNKLCFRETHWDHGTKIK